jgi:peptidyl-prolyl cis-trans isomerase C
MKIRALLALPIVAALATAAEPAKPKPAPAPAGAKLPVNEAAPAPKPFEPKDPIAVVDGENITIAEVEKVLDGMLAQRGGSAKDVPAEMKPELYRQVIDAVVVERLVTKQSGQIEVTDADVAAEFAQFAKRFPDEKTMAEQLASTGQTVASLQKEIRKFIQQQRWMDGQLGDKAKVSEAEIEAYYKENPDQFKMPEQVRASHILVQLDKEAPEADVKAKQAAAEKILARVKKGEDFGKLAEEFSEDPSAKENHGDLDFFQREQMVPEFSDAAFKLKKGEVSATPVRSEFGLHIIKVTDRKEPGTVALAEAKPQLASYLEQQKRQVEMGKILRVLRESAKVQVNLPTAE